MKIGDDVVYQVMADGVCMASAPSICRPGHGASCALCCGSHNYMASPEELDALFRARAARVRAHGPGYMARRAAASRSDMTGSYYFTPPDDGLDGPYPPLYADCPRCALAGIDDGGHVGCLVATDTSRILRHDCVLCYGGKDFTCRAKELLSEMEWDYAAALTADWYYYSILIQCGDILKDIMRRHREPEDISPDKRKELRGILGDRLTREEKLHRLRGYFY